MKDMRTLIIILILHGLFTSSAGSLLVTEKVGRFASISGNTAILWLIGLAVFAAIPIACVLFAYDWGKNEQEAHLRRKYTLVSKALR